jgi:hypothetical protein
VGYAKASPLLVGTSLLLTACGVGRGRGQGGPLLTPLFPVLVFFLRGDADGAAASGATTFALD